MNLTPTTDFESTGELVLILSWSSHETDSAAKKSWNYEKDPDTSSTDRAKAAGNYDVVVKPRSGSLFPSEAMTLERRNEFGDDVSISAHDEHRQKQQQAELIKLFEEYSINQVPIPLAIPKPRKNEHDTQQRLLKATETQKAEQMYLSTLNIPQRKRRLSTVRAKIIDMKTEMRALTALKSGKFANS